MVQMGDFTTGNGKGGESIYGGQFDDEDLRRNIDEEGLLVMANRGKNTNGSQFFVSLRPCPHLDGKHVVFGKVVKGYEIITAVSKLPVDAKDVPISLVTISNCGELERRKRKSLLGAIYTIRSLVYISNSCRCTCRRGTITGARTTS